MSDGPIVNLPDAAATEALGAALARASVAACVIHLQGDLGTGKTTLARGFLRGLGHQGRVKSPTYTLVEPYELTSGSLYHLDLYRLSDPGEAAWLGLEELQERPARVLVEWPERGGDWLPAPDLVVRLSHAGRGRKAALVPRSARGRDLLRDGTYPGVSSP